MGVLGLVNSGGSAAGFLAILAKERVLNAGGSSFGKYPLLISPNKVGFDIKSK